MTENQTVNQTIALSQVGKAYDRFGLVIRRALRAGVSPEAIIDFLDDPATQLSNRVMRKIINDEVMVPAEDQLELEGDADADTVDQDKVEDDDTVVINNDGGIAR